jgi:D-alanyl-D-alanine carboxypeptidase
MNRTVFRTVPRLPRFKSPLFRGLDRPALRCVLAAGLCGAALLSSPTHAETCEAASSASPAPVARPAALPALPLEGPFELRPSAPPARAALDAAADAFASRAPAWSLAVAGPDHGLWHRTIGAANDARFHAASIGKSMTAVLIFQLVDDGELDLAATLDRWYPDLPNAARVTIDHLLTHRSGYLVPADGPLSGPYRSPEEDFERLKATGAAFCPGTGWAYSNVGYQLLGRILEQVTGRSYGELLQDRILDPLSLTNTRVIAPRTPDPKRVQGHQGGIAVADVDYATPFAAAPVSTNAQDLLRYWQALLSGRLVSSASLERMIDPAWPMFGNLQMRYGAGLQVAEIPDGPGTMLMHSGGISGFAATVAWLAERELFVAVLTNERQVPAEAALWALVRALEQE